MHKSVSFMHNVQMGSSANELYRSYNEAISRNFDLERRKEQLNNLTFQAEIFPEMLD